ncbi:MULTISPECIES: ABC transporter ATP-binding protein [Dictyoglomus]|jgi:peptide/nickel transport system ATP-binding protein|uniref:Oligopeptide/dipeptide ABC transporter, ATPase subunit n=1 Tax=Dictyoglomus turgidum (strain DSM 6724 / Z-1310) TaxID=515635 RepID=B8DYP2_DICTD|nr:MULTISPECIES: ABC transporter ATP-binding protein [Dictyoglomus]ACK41424.1 oligopeptide/dipeptide ABC transporter, ATPase subunit [Dictyoglomus turgidum DSM 6724]HBU31571.1 ABC transporter ATP-binding protein [Dictyoglomus sp.]
MSIILKTENLKAFYILKYLGEERVIKAVNGINLEIPENEIYGIAGESGCGKSTLLKVLLATLDPPLKHIDGSLYYNFDNNFIDVLRSPKEELKKFRWKFISYIPQGSMHVLNPVKKVKDTFLEFLESHVKEKDKKDYLELSIEHLRELGLSPETLEAYPHQLSGGMRQRVVIALSTLLHPQIILADEPTTALDVVAQRAVIQLLKRIQNTLQNTIIIVTHDMGIHAQITTKMAIMYAGKIVESASTKEIFKNPLHPYTKYLIQSLPHIGDKEPREGIQGSPPSLISLPPGCAFHPRCPYAQPICKSEEPTLKEVSSEHKVACFIAS